MSSHDNAVDGAIGFGAHGIGGRTAIGDPTQPGPMIVEAGAAGAMTLDEAENIAARRLEELAIRLGDGDADGSDDEPGLVTFDADRHLRTRLARRMASLDDEDWSDDVRAAAGPESNVKPLAETGICAHYVVSEALPLAAFGNGLAALSAMRSGLPVLPAPADDEAPVGAAEPMALAEREQTGESRDDISVQTIAAVPDSAMRLVDLIKEQRLLLDRLGRLEGLPLDDAALSAVGADEMTRAGEASRDARSDAEELFEVGTYASQSELEVDDGPDPVSISAEQLIAALNQTTPEDQDKAEPEIETASAVEGVASNLLHDLVDREAAPRLQFVLHQPSPLPVPVVATDPASRPVAARAFEQHRLLPAPDLTGDADPERPPIIIERARAEMSALANGAGSLHAAPPSAAPGFFAGLSLSLVCGVMLYFVL